MTILFVVSAYLLLSAAATTIASVLYIRSTGGADVDPDSVLFKVAMLGKVLPRAASCESTVAEPVASPSVSEAPILLLGSDRVFSPWQTEPPGKEKITETTRKGVITWVEKNEGYPLRQTVDLDEWWAAHVASGEKTRHIIISTRRKGGQISASEARKPEGKAPSTSESGYAAFDYSNWLWNSVRTDPKTVN